MAEILEIVMIVSFGASWPFNITKSLRSRTAKGKSIYFEICIIVGYVCGVIGKFIGGNITYVIAVYLLDICMVSIDLALTLRNRRLDRQRELEEAK